MSRTGKDWAWATRISCVITAISTVALVASQRAPFYSLLQEMGSAVSWLGAPGALTGLVLAVLLNGSYGGSGTFILIIAAFVNLTLYTLVIFSATRLFRAVRKRAD